MSKNNLVPLDTLPEEEAKDIRSKGGKVSAENRRRRKALKTSLNILLGSSCTDKDISKVLKVAGIEDPTVSDAIAVSLVSSAIKGDINAIKLVHVITEQNRTAGDRDEQRAKTEFFRSRAKALERVEKNTEDKVKELFDRINDELDNEP